MRFIGLAVLATIVKAAEGSVTFDGDHKLRIIPARTYASAFTILYFPPEVNMEEMKDRVTSHVDKLISPDLDQPNVIDRVDSVVTFGEEYEEAEPTHQGVILPATGKVYCALKSDSKLFGTIKDVGIDADNAKRACALVLYMRDLAMGLGTNTDQTNSGNLSV